MRTTALLLAALAAISVTNSTTAKAQEFPWCAHYVDDGGSTNCGFYSQEQCEMTIRGMGGFCTANSLYHAPAAAPVAAPEAAAPLAASAPRNRKVVALTAKEKMKTCQFGADDQKLAGAARTKFISRCMTNRDDPRGPAPAPK
jgi:hypothetical protein